MKIITVGLVIFFTYNIISSSSIDLVAKQSKSQILPLKGRPNAEATSLASTQNKHALKTEARDDSGCSSFDWTCENGQCINIRLRCDGYQDCSDGSDESFITCRSYLIMGQADTNDEDDVCLVPILPLISPLIATKDGGKKGETTFGKKFGEKDYSYALDSWNDDELVTNDEQFTFANGNKRTWAFGCKNDKADFMILFNRIQDTKITLFDDSDPFDGNEISTDDDYTFITVLARGPKDSNDPVTIPTFEKSQYHPDKNGNQAVYVNYATNGNLDGKVSSLIIEFPDVRRVTIQANQVMNSNGGSLGSDRRYLNHGNMIQSPNKEYNLQLQEDGNLVLRNANEEMIWASNSYERGEAPYRLLMQPDNNLVIYDGKGKAIWSTDVYITDQSTWKKPGFAALQDDGNFVVYDGAWDVMWDAGTKDGKQGEYGQGNKHDAKPCKRDKECKGGKCKDGKCEGKTHCVFQAIPRSQCPNEKDYEKHVYGKICSDSMDNNDLCETSDTILPDGNIGSALVSYSYQSNQFYGEVENCDNHDIYKCVRDGSLECGDYRDDCKEMIEKNEGECEDDSEYMHFYCKKSCKICE